MSEAGITVIIPARDEQAGIGVTLAALRAIEAQLPAPVQIIVIDDGSRDATRVTAERAGVEVHSHPQSGGYGRALKTGIRAARHELIAITDADGTYPIEALPRLITEADRFDMVVGARTGPHFRRLWRSPVYAAFMLLTNFVTGKWLADPNSGLRVFRRSHVLPLLGQFPNGFSFTTTLSLVLTLDGRFVQFVPIDYRARIGRSKVRFLLDALRAGQGMFEVILRHNPIKAFLAVAAAPSLAGIVALALPLSPVVKAVLVASAFGSAAIIFAIGMVSVAVRK